MTQKKYIRKNPSGTGMPDTAQARARKGHTQEQAAREIGVSVMTVSRWERGKNMPTGLAKAAFLRYVSDAKCQQS